MFFRNMSIGDRQSIKTPPAVYMCDGRKVPDAHGCMTQSRPTSAVCSREAKPKPLSIASGMRRPGNIFKKARNWA